MRTLPIIDRTHQAHHTLTPKGDDRRISDVRAIIAITGWSGCCCGYWR